MFPCRGFLAYFAIFVRRVPGGASLAAETKYFIFDSKNDKV
jgi:hypothetical protein